MLRVRWLGRVPFSEAATLQESILGHSKENYLLLMEHPSVYTLGARTNPANLLFDRGLGEYEVVDVNRGGDVTYHGPGQIIGYPIINLGYSSGFVSRYVHCLEEMVVATLRHFGVENIGSRDGCPGVWFEPESERARKVCAIGVRISRGRTMHGFALNNTVDLSGFEKIVPCGLSSLGVTSLEFEGYHIEPSKLIEQLSLVAGAFLSDNRIEFQSDSERGSTQRLVRLNSSHDHEEITLKPSWIRPRAVMGKQYRDLKTKMRTLNLVTVCEEAGCPNIFECWSQGTATFMINGDRCTRACKFCLVDTRKPLPIDPNEPRNLATAVAQMGLDHCVITAVARDDLKDGGAIGFRNCVEEVRKICPDTRIELLIPDCKADQSALQVIFDSQPDILNHNLETVLRLQKSVRPSASYSRSLGVLASAKKAGLITKSGLMVGLGETQEELIGAFCDLKSVGVDIVTIGQYLRPSKDHLAVQRWWRPNEVEELAVAARQFGFLHVEASPLTRSSYHAKDAVADTSVGAM